MDHNPHAQQGLSDPNPISALQAFENLSIQSQTPTRNGLPSRPSTSGGPTSSNTRFDSPSASRRSSGSQGHPVTSPQLTKRLSMSSLSGASPVAPRFPTSRRPSGGIPLRPASSMSFASTLVSEDAPPPRTAASVATDFFAKELAAHDQVQGDTETVVIIHEACYGHRFSRPRTSKAALSTIVERPERITAAVLGLATAYVRLGSRHSGGSNPPTLTDGPAVRPPFAIRRSSRAVGLLSPHVVAVHGQEWMGELQAMCLAAGARLALDGKELLRPVKVDEKGNALPSQAFHEGDLYLCAESLDALQGAIGGVCDAVDAVFSASLTKRAFVAVRPPGHHCSADFPSGFCWLNNVHVGIQYAAQKYQLTHAVILDFDLHHGDGSQDITWNLNEKSAAKPKSVPHHQKISIGYYSLHDINSYPCEWGDKEKVQNASLCIDNAHAQSVWNVHLEPWSTEDDFSKLYESKYSVILDKARTFLRKQTAKIRATPKGGKPKSAVFISAGFDASQWEGQGMQRHAVNVPTSFYERFTRDATKLALDESTAAEGRVISVLEGGYSDRALTSGVLSHVSGLCQQPLPHQDGASNGVKTEESPYALLDDVPRIVHSPSSEWYSSLALSSLETYDATPLPAPKRHSRGFVPTFASPTESFSQKVVDQEKFYRSMSGTMRPLPSPPRDLTIPPVDWVAASHALCKLLVPSGRTTTSCKPEELAAPRTKKQRQSHPVAAAEPTGRQLRDRKKPAGGEMASEDEGGKRVGRRKTVAGAEMAATEGKKRSSRRSSVAPGESAIETEAPVVPLIPNTYLEGQGSNMGEAQGKRRKSPSKPRAAPQSTVSETPETTIDRPLPVPDTAAVTVDQAQFRDTAMRDFTPVPSLSTQSTEASFETAPSSAAASTAPSVAGDPVDGLTSGIKRITLKLGTREEHDRRVAAQLAAHAEESNKSKQTRIIKGATTTVSGTSSADSASKQGDAEAAAIEAGKRKPKKLAASRGRRFDDGKAVAPPSALTRTEATQRDAQTFRPAGVASFVVAPEMRKGVRGQVARDAGGSTKMDTRPDMGGMAVPIAESVARDVAMKDTIGGVHPQLPMAVAASHASVRHGPSTESHASATPAPTFPQFIPDSAARQLLGEHAMAQSLAEDGPMQETRDQDAIPRPAQQGQMNRGKLPVFSSTGAIPFGGAAGVAGVNGSGNDDSIGAGAPEVAAPDSVMGMVPGTGWDGNGVSRSMLGTRPVEGDVWDVPETPRR
ncbi:hypothetical protein CAC42_1677 [Sphaceloma murrayae]|uniref:Histone deacetylase domain-containing protein n=1 Tax=Sphaceloma murrayae TaxID=2082308 RepID=A0A2K1QHM4_9PEZI|nr:hypothetical protein CAC42_1677 [Sphaceloma murrayae]